MERGYAQLQEAEAERLQGEGERTSGHFSESLAHFDRALTLDKAALDAFQTAEREVPASPHPAFFQGVALNEMGQTTVDYKKARADPKLGAPKQFCAAIHSIERSIKLGMTSTLNPALHFELGWAFIGANRFANGIEELERFLSNQPVDESLQARAKELISFATERINKAKVSSISPMCGQPIVSNNAPPGGAEQEPSVQNKSQFLASVVTGLGYDGNVTKLGKTLPLPLDLDGKGAFFNETSLSFEGAWFFYHKSDKEVLIDKLAASYAVIHDTYDGHSASNAFAQTAFLNYCHEVAGDLCLGFQSGDTWLRDDTQNVSNTLAFGPNATLAESDRLATQLSYVVAWADYFAPSTSQTNLDGFTHRVAVQQSATIVQRGGEEWSPSATLTAQYGHEWTTSEGIVGDRQRDDALAKIEWGVFRALDYCCFVRSVTLSSSYQFRHDQYDNATFPSLDAANRFARRDNTHLFGIALGVKMMYDERMRNRLEALLEYKHAISDSNVPAKTYDDPRILASVKLNF
jgi:hypothetical protein